MKLLWLFRCRAHSSAVRQSNNDRYDSGHGRAGFGRRRVYEIASGLPNLSRLAADLKPAISIGRCEPPFRVEADFGHSNLASLL
jgi:hypothetical protein